MKRIWEESETGLKVKRDYLEGKAKDGEFLGNRDIPIPPITQAYKEGWERIFGKHDKVQDLPGK